LDTQTFEKGELTKPDNIHVSNTSQTLTKSQFGEIVRSDLNKRLPTMNEMEDEEDFQLMSSFKFNPDFKSKMIAEGVVAGKREMQE
jgi:hypothetical protein